MKKTLSITLSLLLLATVLISCGGKKEEAAEEVSLGGTGGGLVFYENPNWETDGWRYLEAAPEGWYTGATDSSGDYNPAHGDPKFQWGAYGYSVSPSAQATGIGTGKTNTDNIVTYHDLLCQSYEDKGDYYTNPTEYHESNDGTVAAKVCQEYSIEVKGETYNDWFLPSRDELNLIYENLYKQGLGGFSGDWYGDWYWSSSEDYANVAWFQAFNDGYQFKYYRNHAYRVRPVRAFN